MEHIEIIFNKIVFGMHEGSDIVNRDRASEVVEALLRDRPAYLRRLDLPLRNIEQLRKLVFMSHKTNDKDAERVARYISSEHNVAVYMAEWDGTIRNPSSPVLPAYILRVICASRGLLVHVIAQITNSMWIGYEVGGAQVLRKPQARIMFNAVPPPPSLPAVVGALAPLNDHPALDRWIRALP